MGYIKVNAWVRDYNVDLPRICKEHLNTFAHSKIKNFMWLFCSHTLLVASRFRGKEANNICPICSLQRTSSIWHMNAKMPGPHRIWFSKNGGHIQETTHGQPRNPSQDTSFQEEIRCSMNLKEYSMTSPPTTFGNAYASSNMAEATTHP
jgi:hypothetical protein